MSEPQKTALSELVRIVDRINRIMRPDEGYSTNLVTDARKIVDSAAHAGNNVQFGIRYGSDADKERFADHMARAAAQVKAEMIEFAERERDDRLRRYAAELEQFRATLPSLAAKLSIEMGQAARMLAYEADGGRDG